MTDYELLLHDPYGRRLSDLRPVQFSLSRRVNEVGVATLVLPDGPYTYTDFAPDQIVTISRQVPGFPAYLEGETIWMATSRGWSQDGIELGLEDANTIIQRRIVAYAANLAQSDKSGPAADLIRAVMRENFGSSAPTGRNVANFLAVEADDGAGATVSKAFAWRGVHNVIRDIVAASEKAGVFCGFDVVVSNAFAGSGAGLNQFSLEFRVFTQQRGLDHRWPNGSPPVILSSGLGSIRNPKVSESWKSRQSFVYAGGAGEESDRLIASAENSAVIQESPFGRIEGFRDVSRVDDATQLQNEAETQLANTAPRVRISGELAETEHVRYGVDVRYGDYVTVSEAGISADVRLNSVQINVDRQGETILAALEGGY